MAWYNSVNDARGKINEVGRSLDPMVAAKNSSKSIDSGLGNNPLGWYHNYVNDKANQAFKKTTGYDAAGHWGQGPISPVKDAWDRDIGTPLKNMFDSGGGSGDGSGGYGGGGNSDIDQHWANRPEFITSANADGSIKDPYAAQYSGDLQAPNSLSNQWDARAGNVRDVGAGSNYGMAQDSAGMLQQRAFGTETSPWADKLYQQQGIQQHLAEQQFGNQSAQEYASTRDRLAQSGGLEGGANERLGQQSMRNEMLGRQDLARQGELQRIGIGINDENQRMALQQQMPQMQMGLDQYDTGLQRNNADMDWRKQAQWSTLAGQDNANQMNADQYNLGRQDQTSLINSGRAIDEKTGQNSWNMDQWTQRGAVLGAGAQADVQAKEAAKADRPWYQKMFG